MAKSSVDQWDVSASNNVDIAGINIGEFCPPSGINDAIRTLMAQIAVWLTAATGPLLRVAANTVAAASSILDGFGTARQIGFLDMPLTAGTAGRDIALADRGMAIPATGNMTIPTNATTAFPIGSTVGIYNNSSASITIAAVTPGTTTLRLGASATTGTRTLAQRGYVTLWKVATDEWVALAGGVT